MERFEKEKFDYEKNLGKQLICIECVTNDEKEESIELYVCASYDEANKMCIEMNEKNRDDKYVYIVSIYTVFEDYLQA